MVDWRQLRRSQGSRRGLGELERLDSPGDSPGVLALHGFGGSPEEMRLVVEAASAAGLRALAPSLARHHSSEALAQSRAEDWLNGARQELSGFGDGQPVILVGMSLGAVLATQLANELPERVVGLVLLAGAFWLKSPQIALPLSLVARLPASRWAMPKPASDIREPAARENHVSFDLQPLSAAASVWSAGRGSRALLPSIRVPTLLAHGRWDRLCPVSNLERTAALLGTRDVVKLRLERSGHIVTRDHDAPELGAAMTRFFERLRAQCAP